jgi:hypothetical protein
LEQPPSRRKSMADFKHVLVVPSCDYAHAAAMPKPEARMSDVRMLIVSASVNTIKVQLTKPT